MAKEELPLLFDYNERVVIDKYLHYTDGKGAAAGTATDRNVPARITDRIPITSDLNTKVSVNLYIKTTGASKSKGMGKQGKDLDAIAGGTIQISYSATLGNIKGAEDKLNRMRRQYGLA